MAKLSAVQKRFLAEATSRYHRTLPDSPAAELLAKRGLGGAERFRLGYVSEPLGGHEMYRDMLSIPYLRWSPSAGWSVVSMRFRRVDDGHPKYLSQPGDPSRLYNTPILLANIDHVAICEGELDAISATLSGIPAVGVAGVEAWKPHFAEPFRGYETVYILADGDEPGIRFATKLAKSLPNAKILPSAPGADVNSEMVQHGREYIRRKVEA